MRTKSVLVLVIIGLITGTYVGYNTSSRENASLQSQVSTLVAEKTDLQAQLAELQRNEAGSLTLISVSFSRTDDTSALLSYWIGKANHTIRAAVYSFTQDALGEALIAAKRRGVDVQVVVDNQYVSSSGSEYPTLKAAGVPIRSDTRNADMHHKFMIIDNSIVATGSYNWSAAAENENDENLIILKDGALANLYLKEFNRVWNLGV